MRQLGGTVVEAYRLGWKAIPLARELLLSNCCALSALGLFLNQEKDSWRYVTTDLGEHA